MDTSETYIKMCEKADEIQAIAEIPNHDSGFYWCKVHNILINYCDGGYLFCERADCKSDSYVWLSRQDQLQGMVNWGDFKDSHYTEILRNEGQSLWVVVLEQFVWFINDNPADEWSFDNELKYGSIEQLWLAFVMKEKYNKTWDGNEWNINTQ